MILEETSCAASQSSSLSQSFPSPRPLLSDKLSGRFSPLPRRLPLRPRLPGFGNATVTFDSTRQNITVTITVSNLGSPINNFHIHEGAPGVQGPVVISLIGLGGTFVNGTMTGTFLVPTTDPTLVQRMVQNPGNFYVNVHTVQFPVGAIRGQLSYVSGGPVSYASELRPANEVPANASTSFGSSLVTLDLINNTIAWEADGSGIATATLSHIHRGSSSVSGPVIINFALSPAAIPGGRTNGSAAIAAQQNANFLPSDLVALGSASTAIGYYVNIHSSAFPGGEMRGQLVPANEYDIPVAGRVTNGLGSDVRHRRSRLQPVVHRFGNRADRIPDRRGHRDRGDGRQPRAARHGGARRHRRPFAAQRQRNRRCAAGLERNAACRDLPHLCRSSFYREGNAWAVRRSPASISGLAPRSASAVVEPLGHQQRLQDEYRTLQPESGIVGRVGRGEVTVRLELRDGAGTLLGQNTLNLGPLSQQQNSIGTYFPGVDLSNAANLTLSFDASAPIFAYAAVNDNVSADSICVIAQPDSGVAAN